MERSEIKHTEKLLPIKQVYIWVISSDSKLLLVSKDGKTWQFPGGKPEYSDDNTRETAIRELEEETGLVMTNKDELRFLGYYTITEDNERYLQIRYIAELEDRSEDIELEPQASDEISVARFMSLTEAVKAIPWLAASAEFQTASKYSRIRP